MFKSSTNQSIDLIGFSSSFYMKQFGLFMSDCIMLPKKLNKNNNNNNKKRSKNNKSPNVVWETS
jgi:starvation-inducible outer membrane lipoprotein